MTLGQKIRQLRLKNGYTQTALCENQITRNMLSQIENDLAAPSLSTLTFLAKKLGVSAGYFFDDETSISKYRKIFEIGEIKRLYNTGAYLKCIKLCEDLEEYDDEICLILAECYMFEAITAFNAGKFSSAGLLFEKAVCYSSQTVYNTNETVSTCMECLHIIKITEDKASKVEFPIETSEKTADKLEITLYLYMLWITENYRYDLAAQIYDTLRLTNVLYRKHISAKLSCAAHNHSRAVTLLREIVEDFGNNNTNVAFRYKIYSDLENSCKAIGDYEGAYNCVLKRNELTNGFSE